MASPTDREPGTTRTSRRGLLAGAAGLIALLLGRRRAPAERDDSGDEPPRRPRTPWIGHY